MINYIKKWWEKQLYNELPIIVKDEDGYTIFSSKHPPINTPPNHEELFKEKSLKSL